jgi:hypothetical protein
MEVEDLIQLDLYVSAVNDELRLWNDLQQEITAEDVGSFLRTKAVDHWCQTAGIASPDKAAVAQRLVDASATKTIVSPDRVDLLTRLLSDARTLLTLPSSAAKEAAGN